MPATTRPLFERIDSWLQEIDNTKTAAAKPAPAKKIAGTKKASPAGMGETSHPSEGVDNNTQDEETGARYDENSADVKKDVPGQSVDATDPKSGGDQDSKQFNIGTTQSATGEQPSVEDDYKSDKDDPGTEHPMNADDVGEKYSAMSLKNLLKVAENKANNILADLAVDVAKDNTQTVQQKAAAVKAAAPAPAQKSPVSATAGYDAATLSANMEKVAADFIAQTIRDADLDADLVGAYCHSYYNGRMKRAADESVEGESHEDPAAGGEGPPPEGAGEGGEGGEGGGADVLGALGAAGADAPPMGGDGGGDPGAGGAGGPGGGMSQEQALQELAMALQELGISPEELAQLAQQSGGAGGGMGGAMGGGMGGPPGGAMGGGMGGGMAAGPPMGGAGGEPTGPPPGAEGAKLASAVKRFKLAGKFKVEEAKTAAQRQARDQIKDYIREITGTKF